MFNTRLGKALALSVLLFSVAAPATAVEMTSVGVIRDGETDETVGYAVTADGILLRHGTSWGFECLGDWQGAEVVEVVAYYDTIRRVSGVYTVTSNGKLYAFDDEGGFAQAADELGPIGVSSVTAFYYPGVIDIATFYNPAAHAAVVYAVTEDGCLYNYDTRFGFELKDNFGVPQIAGAATHFDPDYYRATAYAVTEQGDLFRYTTSAGMEGRIGNFGASANVVDLAAYYGTTSFLSMVYAVTADGELIGWDTVGGFEPKGSFGVEEVVSLAACFHPEVNQDAVYAVTREGELFRYSNGSASVAPVGNFGASSDIVHLSVVSKPRQPLEVVYALTDSGKLYSYDPLRGFAYIVDYQQEGLRSLASYHNPALDPPTTVVYACTVTGELHKYDTTDGLDSPRGYFGPNLDAVLVYAATGTGNLFRYSSGSGDYDFVGNFAAAENVVDITGYYNPRLPVTVLYAVTASGRLYKYDTIDGFEPSADFGVGGIVSVASYLKYTSTSRQAVVYAVSESGGLYRFTTSGGPEGLVGTFSATGSVTDIATYHDANESFGLLYAVTENGELQSYTLADGFDLVGVFPEPDCGTGTGIASSSYPADLAQNYPNPFNPSTTIAFTTSAAGPATVGVYDVQGKLVRVLWNADAAPGTRVVTWDGTDDRGQPVASGVYLCRLATGEQQIARKMMLLK